MGGWGGKDQPPQGVYRLRCIKNNTVNFNENSHLIWTGWNYSHQERANQRNLTLKKYRNTSMSKNYGRIDYTSAFRLSSVQRGALQIDKCHICVIGQASARLVSHDHVTLQWTFTELRSRFALSSGTTIVLLAHTQKKCSHAEILRKR